MNNKIAIPFIIGSGLCALVCVLTRLSAENIFPAWILSLAAVAFLQYLTSLQEKGKEKVGSMVNEVMKKYPGTFPAAGQETEKPAPTRQNFFQEACDLVIIGDYIATLLALVPAIIVVLICNTSEPHSPLGNGEIVVIALLTMGWLLAVERYWQVTLCTPYVKLPLKWVIVPLAVIFLIT
jgi:hypothetical protein